MAVTLLATRVLVSSKGFVLWLRQAQERFTPAPVRCRVDLRGSGFAELWFSGFPLRCFCAFIARLVVRRDQIDVTDAKRAGEMKQRHDGRVAPSSFEIAHILLREARDLGETLLGEALLPAKSPEIPAHELAHVHMRTLGLYIL